MVTVHIPSYGGTGDQIEGGLTVLTKTGGTPIVTQSMLPSPAGNNVDKDCAHCSIS